MASGLSYQILTNPVAGKLSAEEKRCALAEASKILNADIHGLDTVSADEFTQCARELAVKCDVLVVAGGDGTLSQVINSIDTVRTPIGYLPLGSGNAMQHALKYKGSVSDIARQIRYGSIQTYDLISCSGKRRAFMASLGIDGKIIKKRDSYIAKGEKGIQTYLKAAISEFFKKNNRINVTVRTNKTTVELQDLLNLMVVKQPYYGYGMNVIPKARLNDGKLHLLGIKFNLFMILIGSVTAFTVGNRVGKYFSAAQAAILLKKPAELQIDGNRAWNADRFDFTVLPNALKMKC